MTGLALLITAKEHRSRGVPSDKGQPEIYRQSLGVMANIFFFHWHNLSCQVINWDEFWHGLGELTFLFL